MLWIIGWDEIRLTESGHCLHVSTFLTDSQKQDLGLRQDSSPKAFRNRQFTLLATLSLALTRHLPGVEVAPDGSVPIEVLFAIDGWNQNRKASSLRASIQQEFDLSDGVVTLFSRGPRSFVRLRMEASDIAFVVPIDELHRRLGLAKDAEPVPPVEEHVSLSDEQWAVVEKVTALSYVFCSLDQISSGAWGKSLVRTYFDIRREAPRWLDRQEGGITTTAVVMLGMANIDAGRRHRPGARTALQAANAFLASHWVPGRGFGNRTALRDGSIVLQPSLRHTLGAAVAILATAPAADLGLAADAAAVVAGEFSALLSGVGDKCPSATAHLAVRLFDNLSEPRFEYLLSHRHSLARFLQQWPTWRARCLEYVCAVAERSTNRPWFPPYGGFPEYTLYSTFIPWRIAPSVVSDPSASFVRTMLGALLDEVTDAGLSFAPRSLEIADRWKQPDFGSTAALFALLCDPDVLAAASRWALLDAAISTRARLLASLDQMMTVPRPEFFQNLCCEQFCNLLHLAPPCRPTLSDERLVELDQMLLALRGAAPGNSGPTDKWPRGHAILRAVTGSADFAVQSVSSAASQRTSKKTIRDRR